MKCPDRTRLMCPYLHRPNLTALLMLRLQLLMLSTQQGAIPSSQQMSNVRGANVAGSVTGWAREIPLGPSPHQRYVDAQFDAQDARDKAERIRNDAQLKAIAKLAEPNS